MLPAILLIHIFLLSPLATSSSTTPPSLNLTLPLPAALPPTNLTARMNPVLCRRDHFLRPLSDYTTCIPSLFRMYATPSISAPLLWQLGEFRQWGPETDFGGCYFLVDGGGEADTFSVESLLGPAIWALNKCFVGDVEGRYMLAKTRVGPKKDWLLSVVLDAVGPGGVSE